MDAQDPALTFDTDSEEEVETSQLQRRISDAILESSLEKESPLKDSERLSCKEAGLPINKEKGRRSLKEIFQSVPDEKDQLVSQEDSSSKHQLTLVPLEEVKDLSSEEDLPSLESLLSSDKPNSETLCKEVIITKDVKGIPKEEISPLENGLRACSESEDSERRLSDLTKCHVVLEDVLNIIVNNSFLCEKRRKSYHVSNMDKFLGKVKATDDQESECDLNILATKKYSKHKRSYRRAVVMSRDRKESSEDEAVMPMLKGKQRRVIPVSKRKRFKRSTGRRRLPVKSVESESPSSDGSLEIYEDGEDIVVHHKPTRKRKSARRIQRRPLIRRSATLTRENLCAVEEDSDNTTIQTSDSCRETEVLSSSYFNLGKDDPGMQPLKVLLHPIPEHVLQKWSIVVRK